jgi:DNA-binding transcriptional ArsR family regulator
MARANLTPDVFAALANPMRRQVLMALRGGPLTSSELTEALPVARPSAAEQLQVLRASGLVRVERRGRERLYYLDPRPLTDVGAWLNGILAHWTRRLDDLEAAARREREAQ